jgi:hypothetical protein
MMAEHASPAVVDQVALSSFMRTDLIDIPHTRIIRLHFLHFSTRLFVRRISN